MKHILLAAALATAAILPTSASAQALPQAVVAVVDLQKVSTECTACKAAATALRSQAAAREAREKALSAPLQAEGKSIQAALDALNGKEPDAALAARIKAFEAKRQQGAQELARLDQQLQRNNAYISQQINAKLGPIYQQVMQRRGANLMIETGATLAMSAGLDVTNDVLAALNSALPSVVTTAPAPPAQKQPQGR